MTEKFLIALEYEKIMHARNLFWKANKTDLHNALSNILAENVEISVIWRIFMI